MKKYLLLGQAVLISWANVSAVPDFIILGVTKCGTTSLFDYICKHPDVALLKNNKKELHFFDHNFSKGLKWYENNFPSVAKGVKVGEATPGYFWKKGCAWRIHKSYPHTKFIVIFRDPVKRLISEYFRLIRRKEENSDFDTAIAKPKKYNRYIGAGLYIQHIKRWLSFFPREQFLFLLLDDLVKDPTQEVNKVFKFLGLKEHKFNEYQVRNKGDYDLSSIRETTIRNLYAMYEPHNQELAQFLGRTLNWNCADLMSLKSGKLKVTS